ncbi:MAG: hypothetical protein HUU37_06220 [Bdellovibrionales bacterium]|nr:hypothetical protein [Bdellovibrionales bacterium]
MNMKDYFPGSHKPLASKTLLNEAVEIFYQVGIPIEQVTQRRLERMAMCFLAVAGIRDSWQQTQGLNENRHLKTRDIIVLINEQFGENISSGSYDDIRRKDLKLLILANIVINSAAKPDAATNDPTRGYTIDPLFAGLVKTFKTEQWPAALKGYLQDRESLAEILSRQRNIFKVPIVLPSGEMFELSSGDHNLLQKKLIEEFLPRFGGGSQVLYIGDTSNKTLYIAREERRRSQPQDARPTCREGTAAVLLPPPRRAQPQRQPATTPCAPLSRTRQPWLSSGRTPRQGASERCRIGQAPSTIL